MISQGILVPLLCFYRSLLGASVYLFVCIMKKKKKKKEDSAF